MPELAHCALLDLRPLKKKCVVSQMFNLSLLFDKSFKNYACFPNLNFLRTHFLQETKKDSIELIFGSYNIAYNNDVRQNVTV